MSDEAPQNNRGDAKAAARAKGNANLKPFVKGDPRINRKGKPKSFDKLRELAVSLANEAAIDAATKGPLLVKGHAATEIEMLMRQMMHDNPARFVEIAFGKVPDKLEITTHDIDREINLELARVAAGSKAADAGDVEGETDSG